MKKSYVKLEEEFWKLLKTFVINVKENENENKKTS